MWMRTSAQCGQGANASQVVEQGEIGVGKEWSGQAPTVWLLTPQNPLEEFVVIRSMGEVCVACRLLGRWRRPVVWNQKVKATMKVSIESIEPFRLSHSRAAGRVDS